MKAVFPLLLLAIHGASLMAQQPAAPVATPPPGPLLAAAPAQSSWSITIKRGVPPSANPSPEEKAESERGVTIRKKFLKMGNLLVEEFTDSAGKAMRWKVGSIRATVTPHDKEPFVETGQPQGTPEGDFPEAAWVKAKNFAGIIKFRGRDCLRFREMQSNYGDETASEGEAYIDLESRLPLYVKRGEDNCLYTYGAAPAAAPTIPPQVKALLNAWQKRFDDAEKPAARPF